MSSLMYNQMILSTMLQNKLDLPYPNQTIVIWQFTYESFI